MFGPTQTFRALTYRLAVILIGLGWFADSAYAQAVAYQQKVVASGRATRLGWLSALDPTCHALPMDSIAILAPSRVGNVDFRRVLHQSTYPPGNIRRRCNGRQLPSTEVIYSAAAGYVGEDAFVVQMIDSPGAPQQVRYRVIVR